MPPASRVRCPLCRHAHPLAQADERFQPFPAVGENIGVHCGAAPLQPQDDGWSPRTQNTPFPSPCAPRTPRGGCGFCPPAARRPPSQGPCRRPPFQETIFPGVFLVYGEMVDRHGIDAVQHAGKADVFRFPSVCDIAVSGW